jgi:hypothetical protein
MSDSSAADVSSAPASVAQTAGRRGGKSVKTLKRLLKKAGLKVSGKKATLTRRAKKARLMGGGDEPEEMEGARRRRSRSRGFRLY